MLISRLFGNVALAVGALGMKSIVPAQDQTITLTGSNIEVVEGNESGTSAIMNLVSHDDILFGAMESCRFDNHLEYHIRFNAIGKTSPKWCDMMFNNVQRSINYDIRLESCDCAYQSDENGNGMEVVLPLPRPIPKFGDRRLNVEQGIRNSLCKVVTEAASAATGRNRCPNGEIESAYPVFKCNHKHMRNTLGYGRYINFYNNIWVVGEDNRCPQLHRGSHRGHHLWQQTLSFKCDCLTQMLTVLWLLLIWQNDALGDDDRE
ncbi:hypothetical protein CSHISOI_07484 [Colletotrichum shisoi]|uniref:Uncharacterized protein n=1 Tax=Colletotrichum shisoi TaxID=2078593 RepID=A0A5Q4BLW2_9PEZI|nr:hypothetical protein CSHISOI_07484 [Colletotrichum shisoi]